MAIGCAEQLPLSFKHPFSFKRVSCYPFDYQAYNKLKFRKVVQVRPEWAEALSPGHRPG